MTKKVILVLEIKPRERTTLNFKMVTAVIPWSDETAKNRPLFCSNVVPKNKHSSTRFVASLKEGYFEDKVFRFYMLLAYFMSISDQIEMNILMLIW